MIRLALLALLTLAGCATSAAPPAGPPSLAITPGEPAPPQARFYADCIVQSTQAQSYDREANVIRFNCDGAVAQAFFDGLGAWSAESVLKSTKMGAFGASPRPFARTHPSWISAAGTAKTTSRVTTARLS